MKTEKVTVLGKQIYFRYAGQGDPVILLHGSHRSGYLWTKNIPELSKHFTVYAPDRPGYGESDAVMDTEPLPDMAEFAHAFLMGISHSREHWISESSGGSICI